MKDYYVVLGIERGAPAEMVRVAFRALVQQYHPDRNNDPDASRRTEEINAAYQTLKDPQARAQYDQQFPDIEPISPPENTTALNCCPAASEPITRTVGTTTYELWIEEGIVHEHTERIEYAPKIKQDHRLFVGIGRYTAIEPVEKQQIWLRIGRNFHCVKLTGVMMPARTGQPLTLVRISRVGLSHRAVPIVLTDQASEQLIELKNSDEISKEILSATDRRRQRARLIALFAALMVPFYVFFLRSPGILALLIEGLVGVPAIIMVSRTVARLETQALHEDIFAVLADAGIAKPIDRSSSDDARRNASSARAR